MAAYLEFAAEAAQLAAAATTVAEKGVEFVQNLKDAYNSSVRVWKRIFDPAVDQYYPVEIANYVFAKPWIQPEIFYLVYAKILPLNFSNFIDRRFIRIYLIPLTQQKFYAYKRIADNQTLFSVLHGRYEEPFNLLFSALDLPEDATQEHIEKALDLYTRSFEKIFQLLNSKIDLYDAQSFETNFKLSWGNPT